ncbi:TPA: hypothetical protein ACW0UL_002920 [Citrobacter freundii]
MTSREKFEAWWEVNYHNGNPPRFGWEYWRDGDGYQIDDDESELDCMWEAWQAAESAMAVQLANAESKCRELAAENVGMKEAAQLAHNEMEAHHDTDGLFSYDADGEQMDALLRLCDAQGTIDDMLLKIETPATDAFLAEVRAQARNEGINYAAGRLAAAFNHGFVDKPLTEVCDVVRMILDAKEELANSTLPAADGISGEYAEKFLAEFAAQLRKGAAL